MGSDSYRVVSIQLICVKMDFQGKMNKGGGRGREIEKDPLHVEFISWTCVGGGVD